MKILINIIKKTEMILFSIENIMNQEHKNLLNPLSSMEEFNLIINKKKTFLNHFLKIVEERMFFEKKYNIFIPYKNHAELNKHWNIIVKKSLFLKKLNLQNKILLNKKFYFNQYFLELFLSDQKCITYNVNGKLEF